MAIALDILLGIKDFIVFIGKKFYAALLFILRYSWFFICFLFGTGMGTGKDPVEGEVQETNLITTKSKESPEVTDDNSEVEEETGNKMASYNNSNSKKTMKQNLIDTPKNKSCTTTTFLATPSPVTEIRQRRKPKDNCQICGITPASIHCEGPRCYAFFCGECDDLFHKHSRRSSHKRGDISTYAPKVKPTASSNTAVTSSSISKPQLSNLASSSSTAPTEKFEQDTGTPDVSSTSGGTTWACEFCTFINEIRINVCQVCCKTNTKLLPKSAQTVLEVEPPIQTPLKAPTKLTNRSKNEEGDNFNKGSNLYDKYWHGQNTPNSTSNTDSPSASHDSSKLKEVNASDRGSNTRSNRGHGNGNQYNNKSLPSNDKRLDPSPEELAEEDVASGGAKVSEPLSSTDGIPQVWNCGFCTFDNETTVKICQACGKSRIQEEGTETNTTLSNVPEPSTSSTKQIDETLEKSDAAGSLNDEANTDVIALEFMENNHIENYEVAKLAYKLVKQNFKLHDAIEAAKSCNSLDAALAFLEQDCPLCKKTCHTRDLIDMVHCTHRCCANCTGRYFSRQIRNNDITAFVCPVCKRPDLRAITASNADSGEYFTQLGNMLKPIIDEEDHQMYHSKLTNWFLRKNPNFTQCPFCPYGDILEDISFKHMTCPQCDKKTCLNCKQIWIDEHECVSSEDFAAGKGASKKKPNKNTKQKEQNEKPTILQKVKTFVGIQNVGARSITAANDQTSEHQRCRTYATQANSSFNTSGKQQALQTRSDADTYQHIDSQFPQLGNQQHSQHNSNSSSSHQNQKNKNNTSSHSPNNAGRNPDHYPYPRNPTGSHANYNTGAVSKNTGSAYNRAPENNNTSSYNQGNTLNNVQERTRQDGALPKHSIHSENDLQNFGQNENSTKLNENNSSKSSSKFIAPHTEWNCNFCTGLNEAGERICQFCAKSFGNFLDDQTRIVDDLKLGSSADGTSKNNSSNILPSVIEPAEEALIKFEDVHQDEGSAKAVDDHLSEKLNKSTIFSRNDSDIVNRNNLPLEDSEMDWQPTPNVNYNTHPNKGREDVENHWTLISKKANQLGYSHEELEIAMSQCGDEGPIQWLQTKWHDNITQVRLSATFQLKQNVGNGGNGNVTLNTSLDVTIADARTALIIHKGDCLTAIGACIQHYLKKVHSQLSGELSPAVNTIYPEPYQSNVEVRSVETERIVSHQEMQISRSESSVGVSTEQRNHQYHQQVQNRSTFLKDTPGVHRSGSLVQIAQSHLPRINSALDNTAQNITQMAGAQIMQQQPAIQTQPSPANPYSFGYARTIDGLHVARPAISDYKEGDML